MLGVARPMRNKRVKIKTRVAKIRKGRLKAAEPSVRGGTKDVGDASLISVLSDGQPRRDTHTGYGSRLNATKTEVFVPVLSADGETLMPTIPSRARRWTRTGKATPFWKKGIFCVRLNVKPSDNKKQSIVVGVDPGSKKEGFTVKSESHTYINIQTDAVTWVRDAVETRRNLRKTRRYRKTPCRKNRTNRSSGTLAPSTKARWQWKLRICNWLKSIFPVDCFVVEDIRAKTKKGQKRWNTSFSPLEAGKKWFYSELGKLCDAKLKQGYETKELRDIAGLKKTSKKMSNCFNAHCVDSWVLANSWIGGHIKPDNEAITLITPLQFHRRQLHVQNPAIGGVRRKYGGTTSLEFKRGSIVKHVWLGLCYVGGTSKNRISLHNIQTGERISRTTKPEECKFLTYNSWRLRRALKCVVPDA